MRRTLARYARLFVDYAERKELFFWLGLLIAGVKSLDLVIEGQTTLALVLGFTGGVILSVIAAARSARKRYPVTCQGCEKDYLLEGPRGKNASISETVSLIARTRLESLTHSIRNHDGTVSELHWFFRNLGRNGRASAGPPARELPAESIHSAPGVDGRTLLIIPPAPIKAKDVIEIRCDYRVVDGFQGAEEAVGKRVIFPIDKLAFRVVFSGCQVGNAVGTKHAGGLPVDGDGGYVPLEPEAMPDGETRLTWTVDGAQPGERYALTWKWL